MNLDSFPFLIVFLGFTSVYGINLPRSHNQEPDDALGTHIIKEHKDKVIKNLTAMAYKKFVVFDYYMLKKCPHGHLDYVIAFTGMQFGTNKKYGYLCPDYNHEQVVYVKGPLF
jgi:hypothetical protein